MRLCFMFNMSLSCPSRLGNSLRYIVDYVDCNASLAKYYVPKTLCRLVASQWWTTCCEEDVRLGSQIRDLVFSRDSLHPWLLTKNECSAVISHLCTL